MTLIEKNKRFLEGKVEKSACSENKRLLLKLIFIFLYLWCPYFLFCYLQVEYPMKNLILTFLVGVVVTAMDPVFAMNESDTKESSYKGLTWKNRPEETKIEIDKAYSVCSCKTRSNEVGNNRFWGKDGERKYRMAEIDDTRLVHHLISSNPDQKVWFFGDLGSGNYAWVDHLATKVNNFTDIPDDITVNIIGVGAEGYAGPELVVDGKCNIFKIGQCNIEKLEEELPSRKIFKENNINLVGQFDAMFTRWCMRHLVDPAGLIPQIGTFLKSGTGLFFGDGFFYGLEGLDDYYGLNGRTLEVNPYNTFTMLLLDLKVPFLIYPYDGSASLNQFVFRKDRDGPLNLPLEYVQTVPLEKQKYIVESGFATVFKHIGPLPQWIGDNPYPRNEDVDMRDTLCGDFTLFSFFKDNNLFANGPWIKKMKNMKYSFLGPKK